MKQRNLIAYISLILAIDIAVWNKLNQWWLILIDVGILLVCIGLTKIENLFYESNHRWIDKVLFRFSKNSYPYIVKTRTVEYKLLSHNDASLSNCSTIKITKEKEKFFIENYYQWEQTDPIQFKMLNPSAFTCERTEEYNWTSVKISPKSPVSKGEELEMGFELNNLKISNLFRHSFLRIKVTQKIEKLKLIAFVDKSLQPIDGKFVVQNDDHRQIASEPLIYNPQTQMFEKELHRPRKGRYYAIQWGYRI